MNKKARLLACLGLLTGLAVAPAYGQAWGVRVKVPFKFVIGNKTLPEGEYVLSLVREELFVQDSEGKYVAIALTNAVGGRTVGSTRAVIFHCYTDLCFLSQVWTTGQESGCELLRSRVEKEVSKREGGKYFVLLGTEPRK